MTDATGIPLEPIASALMPYAIDISTILIGAGVAWFAARVHVWTGKEMVKADQDTLAKAINDAAGVIFAGAEAGISTQSIHVGDQRIVAQAGRIAGFIPLIVNALGLTPDNIAHMIAGRLGELQAQSTATSPAPLAGATRVEVVAVAPALPAPAKAG